VIGWAAEGGLPDSRAEPRAVGCQAADSSQPSHCLHPGDVACVGQGERLETLLGSCIAIILTDPRRTVGAMCHIVHASPAGPHAERPTSHGDAALATLCALLQQQGIQPQLCEAWVIGGGNMFPGLFRQEHVGQANARWVMHALAHMGVRVLGSDVGGPSYRRLAWTVGPGDPEVVRVEV
jgi:chemotaxis protein CheD